MQSVGGKRIQLFMYLGNVRSLSMVYMLEIGNCQALRVKYVLGFEIDMFLFLGSLEVGGLLSFIIKQLFQ